MITKQVKILIILYCIIVLTAGTTFPYLWTGAWYHLNAIEFVLLTRIIWLLLKDTWRLVGLVMHIVACNNLLDELFFNPVIIDYNEYLTLVISIAIIYKSKDKWKKF